MTADKENAMLTVSAAAETGAAPAGTAAADRPLPLGPAAGWIAWFSFREMARRRRLLLLALVSLLPVAVAAVWRAWGQGEVSAPLLLANLGGMLYVHFLVAVVALAVGLSAIGEQVAEGTIIYYWTRPLSRAAIYLGRLAAAQAVASTLLVASLAVCFVVMTAGNFSILTVRFVKLYLQTGAVILLGALVYTAIFACLGTAVRRPLLPAVLFAFGWESVGGTAPVRLQQLTVVFHLRNLIRNTESGTRSVPNLLQELMRQLTRQQPVPWWQSLLVLLVIMAVATLVGIWLLRRKEIFR